jgi:hypothetical protein
MRAFLIAAGIAVGLFMSGGASGQSIGIQGISSAQGKTGPTSQLQINFVYDASVTPANFPGPSNITEAQFKSALAEALATIKTKLFAKSTFYVNVYWVPAGTSFGGCGTLQNVALSASCWFLANASWSQLVGSLTTNALSTNAMTAVANLPGSNPLPGAITPFVPYPQAVLFGYQPSGGAGDPDCAIAINNGFNYTPTQNGGAGPIAAGTWDLVGAFMHELGLCMGKSRDAGVNGFYTVLDAMSYSAASTFNFTHAGTTYFSVNGGVTKINGLNQNSNDFASWDGTGGVDSFNFVYTEGAVNPLTSSDVRILDAIGYQCGSC